MLEISKTWECPQCKHTTEWSYNSIAEQGSPVCSECDTNMKLLDTETAKPSAKTFVCPHCKEKQTKILKWINASIAQQYDVDSGHYDKDVDEVYGEHELYECSTCGKELDYEFVETQVQHRI